MPELRLTGPRKAILRAIYSEPGRIYFEAGHVWDKTRYIRVTAIARYLVLHRLIRVKETTEPFRRGETKALVYYRLTDSGKRVLGIKDGTEGDSNG